MARTPRIPPELRLGPFSLEEAKAAGVSPSALRGASWRRLGSGLYRWVGALEDDWTLIKAWQRALPPSAVFAGNTAAWMHGLDVQPAMPIVVALPRYPKLAPRAGVHIRHCDVRDEIKVIKGVTATNMGRTLLDICATAPAVDALVILDMALAAKLTNRAAMSGFAGRPGAARMRTLAQLAAPAESPMETRLRWLLIKARLPAPDVQADLHDEAGRFVGRADLYYPSARLVIEFDGGNHRDRIVSDNRRQNSLIAASYRVLRFTGADLRERPDGVVAQVRAALRPARSAAT